MGFPFRFVVGKPLPLCDHAQQGLSFKFVVSLAGEPPAFFRAAPVMFRGRHGALTIDG